MRALLAAPNEGYSLENGSGTRVSGLPRWLAIMSRLGTLSGTLRRPSMSSENEISRVLMLSPVSTRNAWRTMVVRATSPNVPICGRPDGPYPVSKITSSLGYCLSCATILRASSNGQAFDCSARAGRGAASGAVAAFDIPVSVALSCLSHLERISTGGNHNVGGNVGWAKACSCAPCARGSASGGHEEPVIEPAEGRTRWLCPPLRQAVKTD